MSNLRQELAQSSSQRSSSQTFSCCTITSVSVLRKKSEVKAKVWLDLEQLTWSMIT